MIVIAKNAEEKLLRTLRHEREGMSSQRCFYIAFSKSKRPQKELFEKFLQALQDLPETYMAQVYICQDRDVFILLSGFMLRQFFDFLEKFSAALNMPELETLGHVFEIGVHYVQLETLCQDKISRIAWEQSQIREKERKENAEKMAFETLEQLDAERVATVSVRRNDRREPVVLVVDDDQLVCTLAGNVLREDYQVVLARDGKNALCAFVDEAPDIVFLDIMMPDISGYEVLESLFQIDPDAYVIMFSGRKNQENMMRAFEIGAQGFLGKPFTRERLYHHVGKSPFVQSKIKGDTKGGRMPAR